jgi:pimeloyl-ACP methyl ester carboxylesterase
VLIALNKPFDVSCKCRPDPGRRAPADYIIGCAAVFNWRSLRLASLAFMLTATSPTFAAEPWAAAPVPGITQQEFRFTNGDTQLVGTLYMPAAGDHLPAVVALWGASNPLREMPLYQHLAQGLPATGIAVLIFDRRGSGQSSGTYGSSLYEQLADDGVAAGQALARLARIEPAKIGFWGISQGGWLAVLAANRSPQAAFVISVSAPLVTPAEQMDFAVTNLLTAHGYSRREIQEAIQLRHVWQDYLHGRGSYVATAAALQRGERQPWFKFGYMPTAEELTKDPQTSSARTNMDHDAFAAVRAIKVPALFIYGAADPWVPVTSSMERLKDLAKNKPDMALYIIDGADHTMMRPSGESLSVDPLTLGKNAPSVPAYFMIMSGWLARHVR